MSVASAQAPAVDASSLYFVDGGKIASVPVADGAVTVLVPASGALFGLAGDASSVYWTEPYNAAVKKVAKSGGAVVTIATSPNLP